MAKKTGTRKFPVSKRMDKSNSSLSFQSPDATWTALGGPANWNVEVSVIITTSHVYDVLWREQNSPWNSRWFERRAKHKRLKCSDWNAATKIQWLKCKQEAVLKATAVRSPLPVMSSILPCPPCLWLHGGWWGEGEGGVWGGGGRGHDIYLAIYCTTTWCLP